MSTARAVRVPDPATRVSTLDRPPVLLQRKPQIQQPPRAPYVHDAAAESEDFEDDSEDSDSSDGGLLTTEDEQVHLAVLYVRASMQIFGPDSSRLLDVGRWLPVMS